MTRAQRKVAVDELREEARLMRRAAATWQRYAQREHGTEVRESHAAAAKAHTEKSRALFAAAKALGKVVSRG